MRIIQIMARTLHHTQLVNGEIALVKGSVRYSRIRSLIKQGTPEFDKRNENRNFPMNRDYVTISIANPVIVRKDGSSVYAADGTLNKEVANSAETYVYESFFTSKDGELRYGPEFKTSILPNIYIKNEDGMVIDEQELELGQDAEVVLVVSAYKGNRQGSAYGALNLNDVIVTKPVFYQGARNGHAPSLAATLGFDVVTPTKPAAPVTGSTPATDEVVDGETTTTVVNPADDNIDLSDLFS